MGERNVSTATLFKQHDLKGWYQPAFSFGTDRWKQLVKKFTEKPKAFSAVVLYDPVGITIKLNEYRNEAYVPVDDYLEAKDKYGVTNQRKLDSCNA